MTLRDLLAGAGISASPGGAEVEVSALAHRSESVTDGTLFFCVPGFTADGHDFAPDAVKRGAAALVCERPLGLGVPEVIVPSVREAMPRIAASFYGDPTRALRVVGITGTNGKTTTAFLTRHLLESAGIQTGLLGTVESIVGGRRDEVVRTTPEAVDLQRTFREMLDGGDRACAIEVSSHALVLHRADAITFACAVFTNLTQDHLDFHGTLEDYFAAKRELFLPASGPGPAAAVLNLDDDDGRRLAEEMERHDTRPVTFAVEREADYVAGAVRSSASGSTFACRHAGETVEVEMPLPGLFNVYNALAAIAGAATLGVELPQAADALAGAPSVPGRFEPIDEGQSFTVLVDYAHTPDSLENVLKAARELLQQGGGGQLVCVFGAGGDRDREKRPLMGAVARRLSDHVVVTSDNPRSEDPHAIIDAIVEGAERERDAGSTIEIEPHRGRAIEHAIGHARRGDIVLIAGKGHEQGMEFAGGHKVPFDDRVAAREALRALSRSAA
jgi:UDP-N-acetylmuramoyl-L-alanyl-D-glutamate--2,6-diaminopimelate ligase